MNLSIVVALIGGGALVLAAVVTLIGIPISATMSGAIAARAERRKNQATHESDALGALLRSWIQLDVVRPDGEKPETVEYKRALIDWLTALAEMGAYAGSDAARTLAAFVDQGADASSNAGQNMMVEVVYAVRQGALGKLPVTDKESIRTLLFGHLDSGHAADSPRRQLSS